MTRSRVSFLSAALVLLLSGCGGSTTAPTGGASPGGCPPATNDAYARAVLADNPDVYYRLDEAAGAKLCDASRNHNNGTYSASGATYLQPGGPHHTTDSAIGADGSAQVAMSSANSGLSGSASFTQKGGSEPRQNRTRWWSTSARREPRPWPAWAHG